MAMRKVSQLKIGPVALLVLLALRAVVMLEDSVVRDNFAAVAFLALMALFAFMAWTALRAYQRANKPMPPARESSASCTMAFR
jgi:hypothetical protein